MDEQQCALSEILIMKNNSSCMRKKQKKKLQGKINEGVHRHLDLFTGIQSILFLVKLSLCTMMLHTKTEYKNY